MGRSLIIIKLGGSVVTYKDGNAPRVRNGVIRRLAREVGELVHGGCKLIVVHGAGSFGHPLAKKHELHKGMRTEEQKMGYSQTVANMLELNGIILRKLIEERVRAVGLPPHAFVKQSAGKFRGFNCVIVEDYLKQGFVPVLFGDGVLDDKWGCSILSGDTIVPYLAAHLKARRVVFLSDVDGIFDKDPKVNKDAVRIPEITNKNLGRILKILGNSRGRGVRADVTGEMQGKILAIKERLSGIEVYITSGLKKGRLVKAAEGKIVGTKIKLS